jgi:hypothetical protein
MRRYYRRRRDCPPHADTMPDAAGGQGGHRAARPERVLHRNFFLPGRAPLGQAYTPRLVLHGLLRPLTGCTKGLWRPPRRFYVHTASVSGFLWCGIRLEESTASIIAPRASVGRLKTLRSRRKSHKIRNVDRIQDKFRRASSIVIFPQVLKCGHFLMVSKNVMALFVLLQSLPRSSTLLRQVNRGDVYTYILKDNLHIPLATGPVLRQTPSMDLIDPLLQLLHCIA